MRALAALFAFALPVHAETLRVFEATAAFEAKADVAVIGLLDFEGKGATVTGMLAVSGGKVSGVLEVRLADLKTGLSGRDDHMLETLGADKFPKAKLELDPTPVQAGAVPVKGMLTLKGETQPTSGTCQVSLSGTTYKADCVLNVKLSAYKTIMAPKSFVGTLKDDVKVKVALKAAP